MVVVVVMVAVVDAVVADDAVVRHCCGSWSDREALRIRPVPTDAAAPLHGLGRVRPT